MLSDKSALSPQVAFAKKFLYFNDIGFLFLMLALFLAIRNPLTDATRISIILLTSYLPLAAIFGTELEYRTLLLVPLFAIIAAELFQPVHLKWLAAGVTALALIYVSDPARTDFYHTQHIGKQTRSDGKELQSHTAK
jgi:hypothetical protein